MWVGEGQWPGRKVDLWPACSSEVKKEWSYNLPSFCMPSWPGQGQLYLLGWGGGACFMVRDAVVVKNNSLSAGHSRTDRPTDRPTGLPAHTVSLRAVFGKNKDRRCSSSTSRSVIETWQSCSEWGQWPRQPAWCLDIPTADCRAICDKPVRCLTTPYKLQRLAGTDANDGMAAGGDRMTDLDVARAVRRQAVTAGVGVRTRHSLLGIYGG